MKIHEFTIILDRQPTDQEAEQIYGAIDDATLASLSGVPQMHFHRESDSLEDAISSALKSLKVLGIPSQRVEIEPEAVFAS